MASPKTRTTQAVTPEPSDMAGTARVRAVVAFSHPGHGVWPRGEVRAVEVDDATIAFVESGYLEPVWDSPPAASGVSVQLPSATGSATGQVTVYPAVKGQ